LNECGTAGYLAPELIRDDKNYNLTSKADVFSMGIIFHIL